MSLKTTNVPRVDPRYDHYRLVLAFGSIFFCGRIAWENLTGISFFIAILIITYVIISIEESMVKNSKRHLEILELSKRIEVLENEKEALVNLVDTLNDFFKIARIQTMVEPDAKK